MTTPLTHGCLHGHKTQQHPAYTGDALLALPLATHDKEPSTFLVLNWTDVYVVCFPYFHAIQLHFMLPFYFVVIMV